MKRVWIEVGDAIAIHAEQIAEFGGQPGIRDIALLESALGRPRHKDAYGTPTTVELAAAYAYGIARNHPFIDGNKRTALVCSFAFLELNGWEVRAPEADAVVAFLALAEGAMSESGMTDWLGRNCVKRKSRK